MFPALVKKEFLTNLLNLRILICYIIVFLLVAFSVLIRGFSYQRLSARYQTNTARYEQELEDKEGKSGWWEYDVQIAPRPLSVLAEGFNRVITRPFHVDISYAGNMAMGDYDHEYPLFKIYRVYDLTFIIAFILSLLAVFISFDAVSGEREAGTLRLVLTNPVSRFTVLSGKLAGGYLSLVLPYLTSFLAALLLLNVLTGFRFSAPVMTRLVLGTGVSLVFLAVIFLMTVLLSIVFRRSSLALFSALILWIILALILPSAATQISRDLSPVGKFKDPFLAMRKIQDEEKAAVRKILDPLPKDDAFQEIARDTWRAAHMRMGERFETFMTGYRNGFINQMKLGMALARVSPMAGYVMVTTGLYRTGVYDYLDAGQWKENLKTANKAVYDREVQARRDKMIGKSPAEREKIAEGYKKYDLKNLPSRRYPGQALAVSLKQVLPGLTVLLLECVLLLLCCFAVFVRKDMVG